MMMMVMTMMALVMMSSYTHTSVHTPLTLIFPEGLLRSPQTTPAQPPVERNEKSPLKTFNDHSRGTFEQQQQHRDVRDYGSSMSKSFDQQPTTDPHNYGSSSKSSFDDSSLPSLTPSRPHTSSCAKVQTSCHHDKHCNVNFFFLILSFARQVTE